MRRANRRPHAWAGKSMSRLAAVLIRGFVALSIAASTTPAAASAVSPYIVVLRDSVRNPADIASQHGDAYGFRASFVYSHALKGYAATMSVSAAAALSAHSQVAWVEPDRDFSLAQTHPPQRLPTGVDRVEADLSQTARIDGTDDRVDADIAVLDTGIYADHPDLSVVGGVNCAGGAKGSEFKDENGHGTHVAGTAGALDNDIGVVGVAPGARLWAVRVFNGQGVATEQTLLCGIDWVTATRTDADPGNDIEVANMSLSGEVRETDDDCGRTVKDAVHLAICESVAADVTNVAAAGNGSKDASLTTPATYEEVIAVSALADSDGKSGGTGPSFTCGSGTFADQRDDTFAFFSNFGPDIDLIAPGVCIRSTFSLNAKIRGQTGPYATASGTSMAAPHVAGGAALFLARNPGATPQQVKDALIAEGGMDWDLTTDPDGIHEPLLNVRNL